MILDFSMSQIRFWLVTQKIISLPLFLSGNKNNWISNTFPPTLLLWSDNKWVAVSCFRNTYAQDYITKIGWVLKKNCLVKLNDKLKQIKLGNRARPSCNLYKGLHKLHRDCKFHSVLCFGKASHNCLVFFYGNYWLYDVFEKSNPL